MTAENEAELATNIVFLESIQMQGGAESVVDGLMNMPMSHVMAVAARLISDRVNGALSCKNCGEPIRKVNTALGQKWMHGDDGEFNGYQYCRSAVAEPGEVL